MSLPKNRDELMTQGYRFDNHAKCSGPTCGVEIEWWRTPKGKKIPYNLMTLPEDPAIAHFTTCPDAEDFRKGKR